MLYAAGRISNYTSTIGTTATEYIISYDANGNISGIRSGQSLYRYEYDDLDQLIREDNPKLNKTYVYAYDKAGNLVSKKTYTYTVYDDGDLGTPESTDSYTYGGNLGDRLVKVNNLSVSYDAIGNPLRIYTSSTSGYDLTWQGRQLMSYTRYGSYTQALTFTYNDDGIRTSKTVNNIKHEYILNGSQVVGEVTDNYRLIYFYDELGAPLGLGYRLNGNPEGAYDYYFFEKNPLGDVIGLYKFDGTKIGTYAYDTWGNVTLLPDNIANIQEAEIFAYYNPFRYRGYFYDTQTGLYYLQSRYYNPQWGRFLNADGYVSTGQGLLGYNMFAYCNNNPVMYVDETGSVGLIIYAAFGAKQAYETSGKLGVTGWDRFKYTIGGMLVGDYWVVKDNWETVSETINYGEKEGISNFDFTQNPYYNIWTSMLYASELKNTLYSSYDDRTTLGLNLELLAHYVVFELNIPVLAEHGNPAYLGRTENDSTARLFEFVSDIVRTVKNWLS